MSSREQAEQAVEPRGLRDFVIPGCSVFIESGEEGVEIERLVALIFSLAGSNPTAVVNFSIKIQAPKE